MNQPREQRFVEKLNGLVVSGDRATLAALRRLLSPPERWSPDTWAALGRVLPVEADSGDESVWSLVAGLHAWWHQARGVPAPPGRPFATSMRMLADTLSPDSEPAPSVERRFAILLSADRTRLDHHLRQAITQLAQHDIDVDFTQLLHDLRHWNHPDRFIQRRWARQFWTAKPAPQETPA